MTQSNEPAPGTPAPPPEEKAGRPPFFVAASNHMRAAANEVLASFGEVRSVAVIFDYAGSLNDTPGIGRGVWVGDTPTGAVNTLPAIFGSLRNTLTVVEEMFLRAMQINVQLRDEAAALAKTITERQAQLAQLNTTAENAAGYESVGSSAWPSSAWPDRVFVTHTGWVCSDNAAAVGTIQRCRIIPVDHTIPEYLDRVGYIQDAGKAVNDKGCWYRRKQWSKVAGKDIDRAELAAVTRIFVSKNRGIYAHGNGGGSGIYYGTTANSENCEAFLDELGFEPENIGNGERGVYYQRTKPARSPTLGSEWPDRVFVNNGGGIYQNDNAGGGGQCYEVVNPVTTPISFLDARGFEPMPNASTKFGRWYERSKPVRREAAAGPVSNKPATWPDFVFGCGTEVRTSDHEADFSVLNAGDKRLAATTLVSNGFVRFNGNWWRRVQTTSERGSQWPDTIDYEAGTVRDDDGNKRIAEIDSDLELRAAGYVKDPGENFLWHRKRNNSRAVDAGAAPQAAED